MAGLTGTGLVGSTGISLNFLNPSHVFSLFSSLAVAVPNEGAPLGVGGGAGVVFFSSIFRVIFSFDGVPRELLG